MEWICGNGIAEIGGGEDFAIGLWQCHCRNMEKNLWQLWQCHCRKWEEKKLMVAKIWGGIKKKKCYVHNIFTTFSQQITND